MVQKIYDRQIWRGPTFHVFARIIDIVDIDHTDSTYPAIYIHCLYPIGHMHFQDAFQKYTKTEHGEL